MPDFSRRDFAPEMMDDLSITDWRLTQALAELQQVNRWLGGHRNSLRAIASVMPEGRARVLDVGAGGGDFLVALMRWKEAERRPVEAVGVDLNPKTVDFARAALNAHLSPDRRSRVTVQVGDALQLPFADASFDVAHAGLFLHHFDDEQGICVLHEMRRVARWVVVNDLHRHRLAYHSIRLIGRVASRSPMFRADGPHSVLRGFTRDELEALVQVAGLSGRVSWRWAFRWLLVAS